VLLAKRVSVLQAAWLMLWDEMSRWTRIYIEIRTDYRLDDLEWSSANMHPEFHEGPHCTLVSIDYD
jgi:hypothetical protein